MPTAKSASYDNRRIRRLLHSHTSCIFNVMLSSVRSALSSWNEFCLSIPATSVTSCCRYSRFFSPIQSMYFYTCQCDSISALAAPEHPLCFAMQHTTTHTAENFCRNREITTSVSSFLNSCIGTESPNSPNPSSGSGLTVYSQPTSLCQSIGRPLRNRCLHQRLSYHCVGDIGLNRALFHFRNATEETLELVLELLDHCVGLHQSACKALAEFEQFLIALLDLLRH
jgi:hypothetical protein